MAVAVECDGLGVANPGGHLEFGLEASLRLRAGGDERAGRVSRTQAPGGDRRGAVPADVRLASVAATGCDGTGSVVGAPDQLKRKAR